MINCENLFSLKCAASILIKFSFHFLRSKIVPQLSLMTNSQPLPIGKYQKTTRMTPLSSEDIDHADPLRLNPTEDMAANNEEQLEVSVKCEEEEFEDIVEEEDFKTEEDDLVVRDLSEKEPILVLNTKVSDEIGSMDYLNQFRNILETTN